MSSELIVSLVIAVVGLVGGSGGLFAFLSARAQNKVTDRSSSVAEWKELYDEMKERLDAQEEENEKLREQVRALTSELDNLKTELVNYKTYDKYVDKLESYTDMLLGTIKPMIAVESYDVLLKKKPERTRVDTFNTSPSEVK